MRWRIATHLARGSASSVLCGLAKVPLEDRPAPQRLPLPQAASAGRFNMRGKGYDMRKLLIFGVFVAATAAPAFAQEVTVTGNVTLVSDYAWRNVTQSNQDMTIQGGLDLTTSNGFY